MKKVIKRNLSLFLTLIMLFLSSTQAFAVSPSANNTKTNFDFISTDNLDYIHYTYEENGENYKVIENTDNINSKKSKITSTIYKLNESNIYELVSKYNTIVSIEDNCIKVETLKNGKSEVEYIETDTRNGSISLISSHVESQSEQLNARPRVGLTNWIYSDTWKTSTKIAQWTLSVVIAVITQAVSGSTGGAGAVVLAGVSEVARIVVEELIPTVYFTKTSYLKFETFDGVINYYPPVGELVNTRCYSDRARTDYIGSTQYEYLANGAGQ